MFFLLALPIWAMKCPGSKAFVHHASCQITVTFPSSACSEVKTEMLNRISGKNGWVDPHKKGTYSTISGAGSTDMLMKTKRLTGNKKYTDLQDFTFATSGSGCVVEACSESQVMSYLDYSTNYCNLHDLYCGSADGCPFITDLQYTESVGTCSASDKSACHPGEIMHI
jgi:hypothetical protein